MRILIIGGTGIISTGITRLLVECGDDVVLYNRGQRPPLFQGDYTTVSGDRKDFAAFEKQMADAGTFDIPTDALGRMAPREAMLTEVNFSFNNLFDSSAAREDLGFRVTIPWDEGARRTVQWLADHGMLEKSEDFPFYDRIIDTWRQAIRNLQPVS